MDKMLPDKIQSNRFYELEDLKKIKLDANRNNAVKIFVCNHCGAWNKINQNDIISEDDLVKQRKKKVAHLHIKLTPELKILWNKFRDNWGTNEQAIIVALDDFYKHNR